MLTLNQIYQRTLILFAFSYLSIAPSVQAQNDAQTEEDPAVLFLIDNNVSLKEEMRRVKFTIANMMKKRYTLQQNLGLATFAGETCEEDAAKLLVPPAPDNRADISSALNTLPLNKESNFALAFKVIKEAAVANAETSKRKCMQVVIFSNGQDTCGNVDAAVLKKTLAGLCVQVNIITPTNDDDIHRYLKTLSKGRVGEVYTGRKSHDSVLAALEDVKSKGERKNWFVSLKSTACKNGSCKALAPGEAIKTPKLVVPDDDVAKKIDAAAEGQLVVVYVGDKDSCTYCRRLEAEVFNDAAVKRELSNAVTMKFKDDSHQLPADLRALAEEHALKSDPKADMNVSPMVYLLKKEGDGLTMRHYIPGFQDKNTFLGNLKAAAQ